LSGVEQWRTHAMQLLLPRHQGLLISEARFGIAPLSWAPEGTELLPLK
jgi:hypothetical protein